MTRCKGAAGVNFAPPVAHPLAYAAKLREGAAQPGRNPAFAMTDPLRRPVLKQLFYVSRAGTGVDDDEVRRILAVSQRNNRRRDVTGCLLFSGRHFAQVLEGVGGEVDALQAVIGRDPRHLQMRQVFERPAQMRRYPQWSMGLLYRLDLVDRLEALLTDEAALTVNEADELLRQIATDSVMGGL